MNKVILKISDIKSLVERVVRESGNSPFELSSPESKLEFLITSIKDLINDLGIEDSGDMVYCTNRLSKIVGMVETQPSEPNLDEESVNERRFDANADIWGNIETGGDYGRGVQNRKSQTRRENSKYEKITELRTYNDYIQLINQWGEQGDLRAEQIFNELIDKYNRGVFNLSHLNKIAVFEPIENRAVIPMIADFVNKEEERTNYFGWKHDKEPEQKLKLQPKLGI